MAPNSGAIIIHISLIPINMKEHLHQLGIHRVQKPSRTTAVYWLFAERLTGTYPAATERCGKWLIFVPAKNIDTRWERISKATEEGRLGDSSKVATAKSNPIAAGSSMKVICVYTYDWKDEKDVKRIRTELRTLGITWKIPYKSDEDTEAGKYRATGHTRISKYYE